MSGRPWSAPSGWRASALSALALAALVLSACGAPPPMVPDSPRPGQRAEGSRGMVAASHPAAAEAGLSMLRQGGNAVDAAVATAFAVGVVEPMMAGPGGGGSMTLWLAGPRRAEHLEFYAAGGGDPDYALDAEDLDPDTIAPERGVAVPGTVAGLLDALDRWGTLDRATVMAPAIRLAREGFPVHPLLADVIAGSREKLTYSPEAAGVFYPGGDPLAEGDRLTQPALAATLETIAREGRDGFYRGRVARELVGTLRAGGSTLSLEDFASFRPNQRRPVCAGYRGYAVLSAPPPMGGVELLEALNLLETHDIATLGQPARSGGALLPVVEAIRIARADRPVRIGDPDDSGVPAAGMASDAFAAERLAEVGGTVPDSLPPGDPWDEESVGSDPVCGPLDPFPASTLPRPVEPATGVLVPDSPADSAQTTHLAVVDAEGNAVSLTYTMGLYFGTGAYAAGVFLNSANYNYGEALANERAPYRTPASSTAPTLVLDGNGVRLAVGSPGSGRIPPAILHTILYALDLGLDPWTAVAMPRVYPWYGEPVVEVEGGVAPAAVDALRQAGYEVRQRDALDLYFGGVSAVFVAPDGVLIGVADPRRDGGARGF